MEEYIMIEAYKNNEEEISCLNIHHYCDYTYEILDDDDLGCLNVMWDEKNQKINDIMEEEHIGRLNYMKCKNLMYIEKVKEVAKWKEGETLSLVVKSNTEGSFCVLWKLDKSPFRYPEIIIEPTGYVLINHQNNYTNEDPSNLMIRSVSVYNGNIFRMRCKNE